MSWINTFGMTFVVLMLLPNIIYEFKHKGSENLCKNLLMNLVEQVGRYGSMFLMAFNIGILETGLSSKDTFLVWFFAMIALLMAYYVCWIPYYRNARPAFALALAIIPSLMFILSGILQRHWLLLVFAVLFSFGHIYITAYNAIQSPSEHGDSNIR